MTLHRRGFLGLFASALAASALEPVTSIAAKLGAPEPVSDWLKRWGGHGLVIDFTTGEAYVDGTYMSVHDIPGLRIGKGVTIDENGIHVPEGSSWAISLPQSQIWPRITSDQS